MERGDLKVGRAGSPTVTSKACDRAGRQRAMTPRAPLDVEASVEHELTHHRAADRVGTWAIVDCSRGGAGHVLVCCMSGPERGFRADPNPHARADARALHGLRFADAVHSLRLADHEALKGWSATEAFRVNLSSNADYTTFLLLSYASAAVAGADAYLAARNPDYAQWTLTQASNILLLVASECAASLRERPAALLAQVVTLPVRPFIAPTSAPR